MMTGLVKLLALALAIGAARADATPDPSSAAPAPPQFKSTPIPNHYIVQYHDNISPAARRQHERTVHQAVTKRSNNRGIIRTFTIGSHFQGYHGELDDEQVKTLNSSGIIKRINQDAIIRVSGPLLPDVPPHPLPAPHLDRSSALAERDTSATTYTGSNIRTVQSSTWGQSRISHRLPPSPSPSSPYSYVYESGLTSVYVIDTGIRITHSQFLSPNNNNPSVSRAVWGANFINQNNTDENGHGTHVAGTVGGLTLGISPHTRLVALKVFDGNAQGPWSGVLSALDWACADAEGRNATALSVINMSLGGDRYDVIDDAVAAAVRRGLTVVVAAGNENQNVSNVSPAACPDAIAVGATDQNDNRPWWSNWGPDLDVFAPGDGILSAWFATDEATLALSGTSMASPHVAGLCAYFMEVYGPHTPAQMRQRVVGYATQGRVQNAGQGSPNMLVFNGNALEYGQK